MNHVRVRGTHNSYHLKPDNILPDWQYEHLPLDQQLETQHVRQFELDVHYKDDGFHVYHLPGVDAGSTCDRFVDCLAVLRGWSESHPGHVPIVVLVEPKDDVDNNKVRDHLPELEAEIRGAIPADWLVTPDDVRGDAPDVRTAVTTVGWPRLETVRGRTLFVLLDHAETRDALLALHPKTEGSVFFASGDEAEPSSAFLLLDDATGEEERIDAAVRAGYMVRTMAGDAAEVEAALRGGPTRSAPTFRWTCRWRTTAGPSATRSRRPSTATGRWWSPGSIRGDREVRLREHHAAITRGDDHLVAALGLEGVLVQGEVARQNAPALARRVDGEVRLAVEALRDVVHGALELRDVDGVGEEGHELQRDLVPAGVLEALGVRLLHVGDEGGVVGEAGRERPLAQDDAALQGVLGLLARGNRRGDGHGRERDTRGEQAGGEEDTTKHADLCVLGWAE
jgi:hypothetical protein